MKKHFSKQNFKRLWLLGMVGLAVLLILIVCIHQYIEQTTSKLTFDSVEEIPHRKVGLLLGTGKYANGNINGYYSNRIDATVSLYTAKKIDAVLISGDNSRKDYNEPQQMKDSLVERGIPAERIYLDYAGFRTLDSVVRAKAIFGQTEITVISQKFHNQRSILIGKAKGIDVIGFNAKDLGVNQQASVAKVKIRELFARVLLIFDLLVDRQPKFYGEQIEIKVNNNID